MQLLSAHRNDKCSFPHVKTRPLGRRPHRSLQASLNANHATASFRSGRSFVARIVPSNFGVSTTARSSDDAFTLEGRALRESLPLAKCSGIAIMALGVLLQPWCFAGGRPNRWFQCSRRAAEDPQCALVDRRHEKATLSTASSTFRSRAGPSVHRRHRLGRAGRRGDARGWQ